MLNYSVAELRMFNLLALFFISAAKLYNSIIKGFKIHIIK